MAGRNAARLAVLDTETNFDDAVMSIGVVVATARFQPLAQLYLLVAPECERPSMYGRVLRHSGARVDGVVSRRAAVARVRALLADHAVDDIFAYNAPFDRNHLPELSGYAWHDIMKTAANRRFNRAIPADADCCASGRLRRGFSAECIYRMLAGDGVYREIHNALTDARDELAIMEMLGVAVSRYL